ncbi:hypothetical protein MKW94_000250 [Papaver nudicaule]|uniref:Transposase n=1 Tax=Papaver nudicaule TaxID=74823 RepID=A0AA41S9Z6_PAPNU|nr:hypothetical protein [Papaver nudicaule]
MASGVARCVVPGQSSPAESSLQRRNVRGLTRGIEVSRTIAVNDGNKLPVVFCPLQKVPICVNARKLTSECGIIVRGLAPLQHQSWTKIPEHHRSALIERVKDKFVVDTTVPFVRKFLNDNMASRFTNYRNKMVKHFKSFKTIEEARLKPYKNVTHDSWNYLCGWFSGDTFQKRSLAGSNNRSKVEYNHCGGSLPFAVHRELAEQVKLVYMQTFYDTHTHMVKNQDGENEVQWISEKARLTYERMVELYDQGIDEGSQPPEELAIYNEVTGVKRPKRQRPPSTSSSEFHDLIENLNEKIQSQDDLILKYKEEIKEMKDENQKMKDDNAAFKQEMLNRWGISPPLSSNLHNPPQE